MGETMKKRKEDIEQILGIFDQFDRQTIRRAVISIGMDKEFLQPAEPAQIPGPWAVYPSVMFPLAAASSILPTLSMQIDAVQKRLFERKIRECLYEKEVEEEEKGIGMFAFELFDGVYEKLNQRTKDKYGDDREEIDAMTDLALDNLVKDGQVKWIDDEQEQDGATYPGYWTLTSKGRKEYEKKPPHKKE